MAGHSAFKNIMHRKSRVDAQRSRAFSKHARLIMTAARSGGVQTSNDAARIGSARVRMSDVGPKSRVNRSKRAMSSISVKRRATLSPNTRANPKPPNAPTSST